MALLILAGCGQPGGGATSSDRGSTGPGPTTGPPPAETTGPGIPLPTSDGGSSTGSSSSSGPGIDLPTFDVAGVGDLGGPGTWVCSSDLKSVVHGDSGMLVESCPPDQGCYEGQCVPACLAAAGADGSMGCEFTIPTSPFFANGNPAAAQSGPCHALLVANPWDRPAELELTRDGITYDVDLVTRVPDGIAGATTYDPLPGSGVPEDQVAVVFLAHRPGVMNGTSLECPILPAVLEDTAAHGTDQGVAFELHSDTPIQIYDILPYGGAPSYLPSASLIYPSTAWGDSYLMLSPHVPDGSEWMLAVAREDNTVLSIRPSVAVTPGTITSPPTGLVTDYTLDAGEVLQWQTVADPVGSIITADKPIGVFSGNTYLQVSTADIPLSGRDSAHQMIPDVNALGSEYVGGGLFSRLPAFADESVLYRLVGVVDGTVLTWDDQPMGAPATLDEGEVVEFESRALFSVASQDDEHPFSLSQYMSGTLSGQPGCTGGGAVCQLGDDEWVILVPPQQFLRSYAFFVDPTYGTSTLVVIREAGSTGFRDVELSCLGIITEWREVGTDGRFEVAHVELFRGGVGQVAACETSQHVAQSEGNFGILVWGTDSAASYGYPAGGNLGTINEISIGPEG